MSRKSLISLLIGIPVLSALVLFVAIPAIIRLYQELSGRTAEPRPPDLAECTRIEIEYQPSIQQEFFGNSGLLNREEKQYVSSLKAIVLIDSNDIKVLADEVASAEYKGIDPKPLRAAEYTQVTGCIGPKGVVSFVIWGPDLRLKDGSIWRVFYNPRLPRCMGRIANRHVPFLDRMWCAAFRMHIREALEDAMGDEGRYPPPAEWCDIMEEYRRTRYPRMDFVPWHLACPAQEGRCHFAMNPNCEPNSPADMVLLFETKAGWNQHGGPELFTFDNHDPRGGCVLLNDGTVKFIRTEEELKQLRWK